MKQEYTKSEELNEFAAAAEQFEYMVTKASSQDMLHMRMKTADCAH